jgi:hypothetical protein
VREFDRASSATWVRTVAATRGEPRACIMAARGALGDLLCRERRFAEGTAELKGALALDPGNWPLAARLGTRRVRTCPPVAIEAVALLN